MLTKFFNFLFFAFLGIIVLFVLLLVVVFSLLTRFLMLREHNLEPPQPTNAINYLKKTNVFFGILSIINQNIDRIWQFLHPQHEHYAAYSCFFQRDLDIRLAGVEQLAILLSYVIKSMNFFKGDKLTLKYAVNSQSSKILYASFNKERL